MKTLPHNLEAEQALIGCALYDNDAVKRVDGMVRPIQFYEPFHQRLWAAICVLVAQGRLADPLTLIDQFRNDMAFGDLGGTRYFADMVDRAPPAANAADYARVIADLDMRRAIIRAADALRADAMQADDGADAVIARGEAALGVVARGTSVADAWKDGDGLARAVAGVMDGSGKPAFTLTHLKSYDDAEAVGGLIRGRVNIMAGRPSMGKSAVATALALRMARAGLGIGMFSLEMDEGELGLRLACAAAYEAGNMDNPMYFLANKGQLSDAAARSLAYGAQELRELPLHFDDRPGLKPSQIGPATKRLLRRWERKGIEPGCIIVDHLTIVAPDERTGNKVVDIGDISGALRDLARETDVAFMVLCQLSREVDNRKVSDKRPQLSDLRWSGEIEQDAAQVTFLYRPEKYLREPDRADKDYDAALLDYEVAKDRWRNRILFLNEKNRGGRTQVEVEAGISLGCNALWELNP